jgi:hypothetical protein
MVSSRLAWYQSTPQRIVLHIVLFQELSPLLYIFMKLRAAHSNNTETPKNQAEDDGTQKEECLGKSANRDTV